MLEHSQISEQIPGSGKSAIMARHMLRRLEDLSYSQLTELSREVTAERQRRATEVWGVSESEPTPEPAPNTIAAEVRRRKVIRCYVYLTANSQTWHCDRSCEEVRAEPRVPERTVQSIVDGANLYVANWLGELKSGPCSFCTPGIWYMVRRQHPVIDDPDLERLVQSSSSGSGNPSVSLGSSELFTHEHVEI